MRAVITPDVSESPYADQHEALADELRATGFDVEIEPAADWVERPVRGAGFTLLQAEVVISMPGTLEEHVGAAISAVMFQLHGRVKVGRRQGERRRVQIVDEHGNATWPLKVLDDDLQQTQDELELFAEGPQGSPQSIFRATFEARRLRSLRNNDHLTFDDVVERATQTVQDRYDTDFVPERAKQTSAERP